MSSVPQVLTQEISDTELDNVSGGLSAGVTGEVSVVGPVSAHLAGAGGISTPDIAGLVPAIPTLPTLSA